MPPVIIAVAASAAGAAVGAAAATLGAAVASVLGALAATAVGVLGNLIFAPRGQRETREPDAPINQMIREPTAVRRIVYGQVRVSGVITFVHSTHNNRELHLLLTLAGHPCDGIGDLWLGDELAEYRADGSCIGKWDGKARVYFGDGTAEGDRTLHAALQRNCPDKWTDDHRQAGCAKLYVHLTWDADTYPSGIPPVRVVLRGKSDVLDPRTGKRGYTANAALCIADYIASPLGVGCPWETIALDDLLASANVCDEQVPLAAGGAEPRYACNGVLTTDTPPGEALSRLSTAMVGKVVASGGVWRVLAGYWRPPTVSLGIDDLDGHAKIVARRSRRDLYNCVRGTYISPDDGWQRADLPPLVGDIYVADDNCKQIWQDYALPYTTSSAAGQRALKLLLRGNRRQVSVIWPCKLTALRVRAGDVVKLSHPRYGWTDKSFEVESWTLSARDETALGIDLRLRETDAAVYDWTLADEAAHKPPPSTDLPTVSRVLPPGPVSAREEMYETRAGGGVKCRAILTAVRSDDAFARHYVFGARQMGRDWQDYPPIPDNTMTVYDIAPGEYDLRCRCLNSVGVSSPYGPTRRVVISGLLAPPSALRGLAIARKGGVGLLRWQRSADLDVRIGGTIELRHSRSQDVGTSVTVGDDVPGSDASAVVPLYTGWYWARAVDSSGQPGAWSGVYSRVGAVAGYTPLDSYAEGRREGWYGQHDGTSIYGGGLLLAGGVLISQAPAVSTWPSVAALGGARPSGVYALGGGFALAKPRPVRMTATIDTHIVGLADRIGARGPVSAWSALGAPDVAVCGAEVWYRDTDMPPDDPDAEWSDWQRLDAAEIYACAIQAQIRLATRDPACTPLVERVALTMESIV